MTAMNKAQRGFAFSLAAVAILAGCTTTRTETATKAKAAASPLFGFRVISRVSPVNAGELIVVASHRSRNHRIERIALIGPGGRTIQPLHQRKDRLTARSSRVIGRPGGAIGIGTGGIGFGIGAPLNLDAFLDSIFLSDRSGWRYRTVATVRKPVRLGARSPWKIRVTLTDRKGSEIHVVRPLYQTMDPTMIQ